MSKFQSQRLQLLISSMMQLTKYVINIQQRINHDAPHQTIDGIIMLDCHHHRNLMQEIDKFIGSDKPKIHQRKSIGDHQKLINLVQFIERFNQQIERQCIIVCKRKTHHRRIQHIVLDMMLILAVHARHLKLDTLRLEQIHILKLVLRILDFQRNLPRLFATKSCRRKLRRTKIRTHSFLRQREAHFMRGHHTALDFNQRCAWLSHPRVHHLNEFLAAQLLKQLLRVGVAKLIFLEIVLNFMKKRLFTQIRVQHMQYAGAFMVRDTVKQGAHIRRILHFQHNLMRLCRAISQHGAMRLKKESIPQRILWMDMVAAHKLHKRGKTFVEPNIAPPRHCHEIAKPLMTKLVRNHQRHMLLNAERTFIFIAHETNIAIRHHT
mmetsp:Transcript_42424/g.69989  ORF Transcript_42424/g.69989 Transcript_42424/m.69989 type:complete len:378 (-) Transcript_42424:1208-2341(-)